MSKLPVHFFVYGGTCVWSIFIEILLEVVVWSEGKLFIAIGTYFSRKASRMKSAFLNFEFPVNALIDLLIYIANQWISFYMMRTLVVNGLIFVELSVMPKMSLPFHVFVKFLR